MPEQFIIETRALSKEFNGFLAVNEVNLRVRRGHIHALIGPNGAGKTTCFTFAGPLVGAAVVVTLQEYLSDIVGGWVTVIVGVVFIACVLAFRRGIVGELSVLLQPRR
jgi:ABC-type Na+ transport system ATPase subunit NatA